MKATEIYNKAKNEVIAFASYQMSNIKDWLVRTGEWEDTDENTWNFSPYWLSLSDFKKSLCVFVPATNAYTLDFYDVKKEVVAIRFTINKEIIVVFDESGEDELYLATLELSEQVKVCNLLEELWTELIHQKN